MFILGYLLQIQHTLMLVLLAILFLGQPERSQRPPLSGRFKKAYFCDFFKMSQSFPKTCNMKKYRNWIVFKSQKQSYRYLPSKMKYRELWPKNVEFSVHFGGEVTFVASCADFFAQKKRDFFPPNFHLPLKIDWLVQIRWNFSSDSSNIL